MGFPSGLYADSKSVYHTQRAGISEQHVKIKPGTSPGKVCDELDIVFNPAHSSQQMGGCSGKTGP